jgi:MFS family permease
VSNDKAGLSTTRPHRRWDAFSFIHKVEEAAYEKLEEAVARAANIPNDPDSISMRARFVIAFAAVYGLGDADIATIGTAGTELRHALNLSNFELGALAAVATGVGAVSTVPAGVLADRRNRVQLLAVAVALWSLAMVASSFAVSFAMLLVTRVLLGAVLAVAGPATASLLGDLWPAADRGRIYGLITSGELVGAGLGFLVSGELAAISWRVSFFALALPAAVLAWHIKGLPEPERTVRRIPALSEASDGGYEADDASGDDGAGPGARTSRAVAASGAERADCDTETGSLWRVVVYVLSIRTNIILIVTEALSYFFVNSVETFGQEFAKGEYHVAQAVTPFLLLVVGGGAVVGATVSGQVADTVVRRGRRRGRLVVAALATVVAVVGFIPGLMTHQLVVALPALVVAGFGLAAINPPLDATRLEVVQSAVWGRAEAVRTVFQMGLVATAPLSFGALADTLAGGGQRGLQEAFLVMLAPLLLSGLNVLVAMRTYPRDRAKAWQDDHGAAMAFRSRSGALQAAGSPGQPRG